MRNARSGFDVHLHFSLAQDLRLDYNVNVAHFNVDPFTVPPISKYKIVARHTWWQETLALLLEKQNINVAMHDLCRHVVYCVNYGIAKYSSGRI